MMQGGPDPVWDLGLGCGLGVGFGFGIQNLKILKVSKRLLLRAEIIMRVVKQ